jgi:hypothetical protein
LQDVQNGKTFNLKIAVWCYKCFKNTRSAIQRSVVTGYNQLGITKEIIYIWYLTYFIVVSQKMCISVWIRAKLAISTSLYSSVY